MVETLRLTRSGRFDEQRAGDFLHWSAVSPCEPSKALYARIVQVANCYFVHDAHSGFSNYPPEHHTVTG